MDNNSTAAEQLNQPLLYVSIVVMVLTAIVTIIGNFLVIAAIVTQGRRNARLMANR